MKSKTIATGWRCMVWVVTIMVLLATLLCGSLPTMMACAEEYSNALDDLQKDPSFDISQWLRVYGDYSLQLITIAESAHNELFVYVYQPGGYQREFYATHIRMSDTIDENITPRDYELEFINRYDVYYKYKVTGYTVKPDAVRYYVIIQLMRAWREDVDLEAGFDNTIDYIPFDVSRQFKLQTINGTTSMSDLAIDTVTITSKFVGFVRYVTTIMPAGRKPINGTDRFFVAFSTDHDIDELIEIEISYVKQEVMGYYVGRVGQLWDYYDDYPKTQVQKTITNTDYYDYHARFLWMSTDHHWDLIQDVDTFMDTVGTNQRAYHGVFFDVNHVTHLTEVGRDALADKQWVISFDEATFVTEYSEAMPPMMTNVGEVTILRLKFLTNGYQYNLGVVDNKQTGSDKPVSETDIEIKLSDSPAWLKLAVALVILIVLLIILWPIVPYIAKFLIWLLGLPFKGLAAIGRASRRRRQDSNRQARKRQRKMERNQRRQERKASKVNVKRLKKDLSSGKKSWSQMSEAEEQAILNDEEYVNTLFEKDNWNGED